ncbi:ricin-type beta-trefoil lectin domain protein [Reinekea thalattae]|uniref:Ricin-type beta-trefoil lectin domain protein n=1 Tax=Reinekea thalattae TaxID=2593301 RepID=A0A5C8ZAR0_9GAMM|nr:ricin-type beta-trefoil lectin domain protein [Reinekea thalattae]TXR53890.1 ricin-type beta-trefoil lectin domain protein [Reinekea thalattae]
MKIFLSLRTFFSAAFIALVCSTSYASELVEVRLVDNIDESRGYCLDVAGGQGKNAPVERGLQAHTCYDYRGEILEDQGFDAELVSESQFKIDYFDVCMVATELEQGADLMLASCDNSNSQKFSLQTDGNLVLDANPELCVTASSTEKREGRGGSPVHVMRPVSLQTCSDANQDYQRWELLSL